MLKLFDRIVSSYNFVRYFFKTIHGILNCISIYTRIYFKYFHQMMRVSTQKYLQKNDMLFQYL